MNFRCIFGHKWELSKQEREVEYTLTLPKFSKKGTWNKVTITTSDDIRICKRCYKKQKAMYSPFNNSKYRTPDWRDNELSKDELRDKKLKELGI